MMRSDPDFEAILAEAVKEGRAVIVSGTGVSIATSIDPLTKKPHPQASWAGLLEDGLRWLKDHKLIDDDIADAQLKLIQKQPQTHHFISAAEDVVAGMGGTGSKHFLDWLKRTIGSINVQDRQVLDALNFLRQHGNLLATTNYDGLLLSCFSGADAVTWQDKDKLIATVRNRDIRKIIYLHGYWRRPESVILDWKSYDRIARDEPYREDLVAFWKTNIWVYVGCGIYGLTDPDFGHLLERYGKRAQQAGHWDFCLVRADQKEEFQAHFDANHYNIRAISFGDDHTKLAGYLHSLLPTLMPPVTAIPSVATSVAADNEMSMHSLRTRTRYLKEAFRDVESRLNASIHHARFIDLGIENDPAAIKPAWGYHNPETKVSYDTVDKAFAGCDRRMLILGAPGSGKTTALLHLARLLIHEAQENPDAAIPFLINLSKFRLDHSVSKAISFGMEKRHKPLVTDSQDNLDTRFEDWLIHEMSAFPNLNRYLAQKWLREGLVAVLLDGLDEFNDEHRADLVRLLNSTFLRYYPDMVVVICSRTNEYFALQTSDETLLQLGGGIHLQPLTDVQINTYLEAAQAQTLMSTLPRDPALTELARTPLTLSMLVLAYGGLAPSDFPVTGGLNESRHHLFESYVARMLQRWERRKRDIPFDNLKANDVPISEYRYKPDQVNRWLGWLALILSVRMRTSFSIRHFYNILAEGASDFDDDKNRFSYIVTYSTGLLFFFIFLTSLIVLNIDLYKNPILAIISVFFVQIIVHFPALFMRKIFELISIAYFSILIFSILILTYNAVSIFHIGILPKLFIALNLPLLITFLIGFSDNSDSWKDEQNIHYIVNSIICLYVIFSDPKWLGLYFLQIKIIVLLISVAYSYSLMVDNWKEKAIITIISIIIGCISIFLCLNFGRMISGLSEVIVLHYIGVFFILEYSSGQIRNVIKMMLIYFIFAICFKLIFRHNGNLFAILGLFFINVFIKSLLNNLSRSRFLTLSTKIEQFRLNYFNKIFMIIESVFICPVVWFLVASGQRFPWKCKEFLIFCRDTFILKQSSQEYEFTHRLLRDYFALRALRPKLSVSDKTQRLSAIRSLGFQGEAALDMLIEFTDDIDSDIRAAAISGLSHISSPAIVTCYERLINDENSLVRQELIRGAFRLSDYDQMLIFSKLKLIGDNCELEPLFDGLVQRGFSDDVHKIIEEFLVEIGDATFSMAKSRLKNVKNNNDRSRIVQIVNLSIDRFDRELLSVNLDGQYPCIDLSKAISKRRLKQCSLYFQMSEKDILEKYRELYKKLDLKIKI